MGKQNDLSVALRETAKRLREGAPYRWTHQGMCNCGHLAQTVTKLSREEIHRLALAKQGDWSEHAVDYCSDSGFPIDHIIESLLELGLSRSDITHLERLDDPKIIRRVKAQTPEDPNREGPFVLDKRKRDDVVAYMETWARVVDEKA